VATLWVRHAPSSAAVARRSVSAAFQKAGMNSDDAFDAALIASELVGNAVRHGQPLPSGHLAVEWALDHTGYTISVTDGGDCANIAAKPGDRHNSASLHDTAGRGLMIVAALADRWGVQNTGGSTQVWAHGTLSAPLDWHHDALQDVG
jgi:anti-sigma regulatory factor (Ser/Thr protein kinase)